MGRRDFVGQCGDGAARGWSAFEAFGAATHVLTDGGVIVEANPAFERMFAAPRKAFYGRHQSDLCDGASPARQRLASRILREASTRGSWRGTLRSLGRDGRRFATRAHVYPTQVGRRVYFVCIQEEANGPPAADRLDAGAQRRRDFAAHG